MRALRVILALGLGLYGGSYLWLSPAAAGGGAAGPVWTLVEVLVIITAAGFVVAAWGTAKATAWAERMTGGAAAAGLLILAPYLVASQEVPGATVNAAVHAVGSGTILLALSIPPAERTLSRRAKAARHGLAA